MNRMKIQLTCQIHGEYELWRSDAKKIGTRTKEPQIGCPDCLDEFIEDYSPTQDDIDYALEFLSSGRNEEHNIRKNYPIIYALIVKYSARKDLSFAERIYWFRNKIQDYPTCDCGTPIKKFTKKKYNAYCSSACSYKYSGDQRSRGKREAYLKNIKEYTQKKYPGFKGDRYKGKIINYCSHREIAMDDKTFNKLWNLWGKELNHQYILCDQCRASHKWGKVTGIEKSHWTESPDQILTEKYTRTYLPNIFHEIQKIDGNSWAEKKYIYNTGHGGKCSVNGCSHKPEFDKSRTKFREYCDVHADVFYSSTGEKEVLKFIKSIYGGSVLENTKPFDHYELDIYMPEEKWGIEYNGLYWHSEIKTERGYHSKKKDHFRENGVEIFTIWEDDWRDKRELMQSMIKNRLGLSSRIYARKCVVKSVDSTESKIFLQENHIQGSVNSSIKYGLYYEDILVSLMTFGKKRKILNTQSSPNEYELLRFCNKRSYTVVGAASKLMGHFIKVINPDKIISYSNEDLGSGNLYKRLDFKQIDGISLNYWWSKAGIKYHRSNFMKHKLVQEGADPAKTESQIMRERGYFKIWGSGNLKFEWEKSS